VLPRVPDPPATLRVARELPSVGAHAVVIGAPEGLTNTVSDGIISAVRILDGQRLLQLTAPISPGSSGGPVLNMDGEVVGVSVLHLAEGQNLNFAVAAADIRAMLGSPPAHVAFASLVRLADTPA